MRSKELELEQAAEAYRNLQWLKQKSEEEERNALREKDALVHQLQAALQARSQETQVPRAHLFYSAGLTHAAVFALTRFAALPPGSNGGPRRPSASRSHGRGGGAEDSPGS